MDDYSDDGFDDVNDTDLQELEENAIQFTQAQKLAQSQAPVPQFAPQPAAPPQAQRNNANPYGYYDDDDDDFDDAIVIDELAPKRIGPIGDGSTIQHPQEARIVPTIAAQQRHNQQLLHAKQAQQAQQARALNNFAASRPAYPSTNRPNVPPLPSQRFPHRPAPPSRPPPTQSQFARPPVPIARPLGQQTQNVTAATPGAKPTEIISALEARLSALETELISAKGEAAIIRSKYDKAQHTHEAEVARLRKLNAEQAAKQERLIEEAKAKERHATTELQFARQDLREVGRAKNKRKDGATTPKKNKKWGLADGFDGPEASSSPGKGTGALRRNDSAPAQTSTAALERTPKRKRKRTTVDSPSFALEIEESDSFVFNDHQDQSQQQDHGITGSDALPFDVRFPLGNLSGHPLTDTSQFLRLALDHSILPDQPLTFDLFSRFTFPSEPTEPFSSIIFRKLPLMGSPREPLRLLVDFAELLIDMWQRCLSENYHAPIYYLAALLLYTLQLDTSAVAPHIVASLVPVCLTTCRLVAIPRFNNPDGLLIATDPATQQLYLDIDVTQSLSILYLVALGCLSPSLPTDEDVDGTDSYTQESPQQDFWKLMELEFVMLMLSPKMPEVDWYGMLYLLRTSAREQSIGPIPNPISGSFTTHFVGNGQLKTETPDFIAGAVIDRVSSFLVTAVDGGASGTVGANMPRWIEGDKRKEVQVRLEVIKTLMTFGMGSKAGGRYLRRSAVALPRIVTVVCWAIDSLYDMDCVPLFGNGAEMFAGKDKGKRKGKGGGADALRKEHARNAQNTDSMELDGLGTLDDDEVQLIDFGDGLSDEPGTNTRRGTHEDEDEQEDLTTLLCRLVSQAMRLLHALVTHPESNADEITAKLAASHGGAQRYLLTLARLNFAEDDLVLERGIDASTIELAHELLELAVTPEEGEGVGEVFGA